MTIHTRNSEFAVKDVRKPAKRVVKVEREATVAKYRMQRYASYFLAGVFVVGLGLSLKHQAAGLSTIIHADAIEAWAMAVVIDAGFIGLELAMIFAATPGIAKTMSRYVKPTICGTIVASMAMNSVAFAANASGAVAIGAAVIAGCALPVFLGVLVKAGTYLFMTAR